jgi:hypothetical protein
MALVERLMALETPKIPVHHFFSANAERIGGALTREQVIAMFSMDAASTTEYDAMAALAPVGTNATALAQKALWIEKIHAILMLSEGRYSGYSTAAEVRTKIGL